MYKYNLSLEKCAGNIASYRNNYFRINFNEETIIKSIKKFFLQKELEEHDYKLLSIFIHEYLHFFHNISTVSGFYEFYIYLMQYLIFRESVNKNGFCLSSSRISKDEQKTLSDLLLILKKLYGYTGNKDINNFSFALVKSEIPLANGISVISNYVIEGYENIEIGMTAILEAIAFELMSKINSDVLFSSEFKTHPYYIIKEIVRQKISYEFSQDFFLKILILSLQTNDPIGALDAILNDLKSKFRVFNSDFLIKKIQDSLNIDDFIKSTKNDIKVQLSRVSKGKFKEILEFIFSKMEKALTRRKECPFIELEWFVGNKLNSDKISENMQTYNMCSFIENQLFYGFFNYNENVNIFNAIFDFMRKHLKNDKFISTKQLPPYSCIFYEQCAKNPKPLKNFNSFCKTAPYKNYKKYKHDGKICWYLAGISACIDKNL